MFLLGVLSAGFLFGVGFFFFQRPASSVEQTKTELKHMMLIDAAPQTNLSSPIKDDISSSSETVAFHSLVSSLPDVHSTTYEVKSGDNLTTIAKKHNTTVELIQRVNKLSSDRLVPGMKLKVPTYKFSAVVDKSQNILILKGDEEVLKTYVVSTGENNNTPAGVFKITQKLVNPTWFKAGAIVPHGSPENVLGTRWLGISKQGYGIHGTTEPEKLGQQITAGCVRMKNEEVEELYAFLTPGSEVTIVD